jgi:hypothetical protein
LWEEGKSRERARELKQLPHAAQGGNKGGLPISLKTQSLTVGKVREQK